MLPEILREHGDVLAAFAEHREPQSKDVNPVKQVLPEPTRTHFALQVLVCSAKQPGVNFLFYAAPDARKRAVLKEVK